jgi:acyl carrier protein
MDSIEKRIEGILAVQFKVDTTEIGAATTLGDLSFDSIVLIELALALDDAFGVELGDGELHDRMTISDAADLVRAGFTGMTTGPATRRARG